MVLGRESLDTSLQLLLLMILLMLSGGRLGHIEWHHLALLTVDVD